VRDGERVVDDGDIVTAAGVTSGIDLALHLVRQARGDAVARAAAREIEWAL
jgi:transcriptional regulator GlxA family with amidase domain